MLRKDEIKAAIAHRFHIDRTEPYQTTQGYQTTRLKLQIISVSNEDYIRRSQGLCQPEAKGG